MPCSAIASLKASGDEDEILMKHRLQFTDSLKDLKNLRKQLYSAAEYFESSYKRDSHKQFVVESSKDYVAKALVNTVDHLGCVADKLNKFMDQNANQLSATSTQFSCIQQRLCTVEELVHSRCLSQHLFHKHTIHPGKSTKSFGAARMMADPPLARKQVPIMASSPNGLRFSFTSKEASDTPLSLRFNPTRRRSVSPSPSLSKGQAWQRPTEPRRAISACRGRPMGNRGIDMETYTKKSKHLFKALLSLHHSRKVTAHNQI